MNGEVETILQQLKTPLPKVRRPPGYLIGLVATAVFLVLMPLVYFGLIAGVAWLCWWHLTSNYGLLILAGTHGIYGILLAVFLYLGPVAAGITMVIFMVRPLLIRGESRPESRVLDPSEAPDFVALVHAVADAVGAPRPAEIRVDSQVNASASFRNGFAGWLKGELTLTVGLPLVESMSTREVAGILGHEFGHFAQGGGMRLSFVVRTMIYWFQRVFQHRDSWDEQLDRLAKQADWRVGIFFHLARFFVWLSRRALWAVAAVSHLVCVFLLRAMEYDADRHEARIAGSDQFARTAHHLRRLNLAWQQANGEAARAWNDGALPRDFTAYVGHLEQRLDAETDEKLVEGVRTQVRSLWATHPRDVDRIARAEAAAEPGILSVEMPCRRLFPDFQKLAESCSDVYYAARIGREVDPTRYQDTEAILRSSDELRRDHEAFRQTVGSWAGIVLPLNFHRHETDSDLPETDEAAKGQIETVRGAIDEANKAYDEVFEAEKELACYRSARSAGYAVGEHMKKFEGHMPDLPAATAKLQEALAPVHRRFVRALAGRDDAFLNLHRRFAAESSRLNTWQIDQSTLSYLVRQDDNRKPERWTEIQRLLSRGRDNLALLNQWFADVPYPFSEREGLSLGEHLLGGPVASLDDPNALYQQSGQALERAGQLYVRTLGRLARLGGLADAPVP
jgi:Zn-dependent protease with chaperone function